MTDTKKQRPFISLYGFLLILLLLLLPLGSWAQSAVSDVRAMQEGQNVVLLYNLAKDTEISQVRMTLNGTSRAIPTSCLSGDVGRTVAQGTDRRIVYNVLADYADGLSADGVVFEIVDSPYEFVDLGLSVKWATCNVGAERPEDYGDYFAWGETSPKSTYDWSTYKWCRGAKKTLTKYCTSSSYGTVDNKEQLDLADDAARVNWGSPWRMPTYDEWKELKNKCKWTWTTLNGVTGYKVVRKKNGNSIFLPAAGYRYDGNLYFAGSDGNYWSSSLYSSYLGSARNLLFGSDVFVSRSDRCSGCSVRPVVE